MSETTKARNKGATKGASGFGRLRGNRSQSDAPANFLDKDGPDPAYFPHREEMPKKDFEKAAAKALPHLSKEELSAYLEEGYRREADAQKAALYWERSRAQPGRPMLFRERPRNMKLPDFLRIEYRDKGLLKDGFTRADIGLIDPVLEQAIADYCQRADLPADVHVPKAKQRLNRRERTRTDRDEPR